MGANGLQPILNAIMSIFSFIGCRCLRLSPLTCCVSCSSHTAAHDGSLATVCGDSWELLHCVENH
mgnify:CR=1